MTWVVGVRLFVPVWITSNLGRSWRLVCEVFLPSSIVGHLKYLSSRFGWNGFVMLRNLPFESHKNAAVFGLTEIGGDWLEEPFFLSCCAFGEGIFSLRIMFSCTGFSVGMSTRSRGGYTLSISSWNVGEECEIAWGSISASELAWVSRGFFHCSRTWSFKKLLLLRVHCMTFCRAKLDSKVLQCFFRRDWFSSWSFLIWPDCWENISWDNWACDERWDERSFFFEVSIDYPVG